METGEATYVGGGLIRGDGALAKLPNCGRVVAEGVDGSIGCPFLEGYHLQLHEDGSLLQVAIGQGAQGVVFRDQCGLDVLRKGDTPDACPLFRLLKNTLPMPLLVELVVPRNEGL